MPLAVLVSVGLVTLVVPAGAMGQSAAKAAVSTKTSTAKWAVGDVVIDTAARRVTRGGQAVSLTPHEYALVELLALHRGRLITL